MPTHLKINFTQKCNILRKTHLIYRNAPQLKLKDKKVDELLELCKHNHAQAQMEVYNRYHQTMFITALKIVHNKMDAEDIMQEGFLTAFNRIDQYKGENNFGGWLKQIIIRKSIQHHRDQRKELKLVEELKTQTHDEPFSETKSPTHNELLNALNDLNPRYKNALSLMYLEGYDYEELTEVLQLTYGSCRTLISRAKEQLKLKMKGFAFQDL